jgi:hypothetical protein
MTGIAEPNRSRRGLPVMGALIIGLLATGCGSRNKVDEVAMGAVAEGVATADLSTMTLAGERSGHSATSGDTCSIVSDEVAAKVLGIKIVRREPTGDPTGAFGCIKGTERVSDMTKVYYVSASVTPGGAAFLDQATAQAESVSVPGLGDRAVFLTGLGALFVAVGTDMIYVQVVKAGVPSSQADAVTVAKDVLGRRR